MAVQWAMYAVWLHGHAAGLTLSALRELDGQGRTHLAQYPQDYHSPAELTECVQGFLASRRSLSGVPLGPDTAGRRPAPRPGLPEPCFRWNNGRCSAGASCRRPHTCTGCGGPHPAHACPSAQGNAPRVFS
ncbi:hypothetical protein FJT64_004472 [Amphibalanus amphitrite]|uniref:C3H1-type domain-containing protein n=1 Tax=Amphibalanus amphitrite TaxID=1232801 RepID=A0A6A4W8I5_AMPAM|nr:hypothetical protein FJT64_004472 [Amphibalanus amphitrite]